MSELMHSKNTKPVVMATAVIAGAVIVLLWGMLSPASGQQPPMNPLGIEIVGQSELLTNSRAALRVVVTDHQKREPAAGAWVSIRLVKLGAVSAPPRFVGRTDQHGTPNSAFPLPNPPPQ